MVSKDEPIPIGSDFIVSGLAEISNVIGTDTDLGGDNYKNEQFEIRDLCRCRDRGTSHGHFHHYGSGLQITWNKLTGAGIRSNFEVSAWGWADIVIQCIDSI